MYNGCRGYPLQPLLVIIGGKIMKKITTFFLLLGAMYFFSTLTVHAFDTQSPLIELIEEHRWDYNLQDAVKLKTISGDIEISSEGSIGIFSDDIVLPRNIIIKEEHAGALKEGSKIYLSAKNLKFCDYMGKEVIKGDIIFDYAITENGLLEISILKESTQPSEISLFHMAINMTEHKGTLPRYPLGYNGLAETVYYSYPLVLLADEKLNQNLFSELEKDVVLNKKIAVLQDYPVEPSRDIYAGVRIIVRENSVTKNNLTYPLSHPCYLKDGYFMVPLREMAFYLNNAKEVTWDEETQSTYIPFRANLKAIFKANSDIAIVPNLPNRDNEDFPLKTPAVIKDGVMYISFRDYINITGDIIYKDFYWDRENFLVSFRH